MIALSTAEPVRFTPAFLQGRDDAPVFLIRPGTLIERAQLEAELAGPPYNAGRVFPWDLADAAADAARALLSGDDLGQVLDALATLKQAQGIETLPQEQRQLLVAIDTALMQEWPEYAELRSREARRQEILPLLAAQRFLVGWEGFDTPFTTGKDGRPSETALRVLGALYLPSVGYEAYRLLYAEEQRPLSASPSKSGPDRVTSPAAGAPPSAARAGKLTAKSGRKTRA